MSSFPEINIILVSTQFLGSKQMQHSSLVLKQILKFSGVVVLKWKNIFISLLDGDTFDEAIQVIRSLNPLLK